jgi:choline-sulfatase
VRYLSAMVITIQFLFAAGALHAAKPGEESRRPNVLFVFTDDQAAWGLGLSGHPHAKTPHMDKLFKQGAYLVNAFTVTPVCSPSRASLMTSRYGSELGITDWIHPRNEPNLGLNAKFPVWPKLLKRAGYKTGLIGKWHLGTQDRFHPTKYGYDYFMGFRSGGNVPKDPTLEVEGKRKKLKGLLPDILTDDAMRFLTRNKNQPFMLSLHFRAPHTRWLPVAEEDWAPFKNLDPKIPNPKYPNLDIPRVKRMTREYLASVASVDRNIGRLMEGLDRLNLARNTVVIFSSDHGYSMGHNGIWHKGNGHWVLKPPPPALPNIPRGQRPNMYDLSLRVPTAVRWPGVIKPGLRISEIVSNLDWFPTILAMAGVKVPRKAVIHGRNILPLLKQEKVNWNNEFYAEYSTHHQSKTHMRVLRTTRWKLIRDFKNRDRDELYDLKNDPAEATNLIESKEDTHRRIRVLLNQRIETQMRKLNDPALKGLTNEGF